MSDGCHHDVPARIVFFGLACKIVRLLTNDKGTHTWGKEIDHQIGSPIGRYNTRNSANHGGLA
jgi:hypothetical protein